MFMELSGIDRIYRDYDVTATLKNGQPAALTGVQAALLPPRTRPTAATVWVATVYAAGVATVLLAGPYADPANALIVSLGGADLWLKVTDNPEVDAEYVERIYVY